MASSDQKKKDDIKSFSKKAMGIFSDISRGGVNSELRKMQDTLQEMDDFVRSLEPEGSLAKRTPLHEAQTPGDAPDVQANSSITNLVEHQPLQTERVIQTANLNQIHTAHPAHNPSLQISTDPKSTSKILQVPGVQLTDSSDQKLNHAYGISSTQQNQHGVQRPVAVLKQTHQESRSPQAVAATPFSSTSQLNASNSQQQLPQSDLGGSIDPQPLNQAPSITTLAPLPQDQPSDSTQANVNSSEVDLASLSAYVQNNPDQVQLWTQIFQSIIDIKTASENRFQDESTMNSQLYLNRSPERDTSEDSRASGAEDGDQPIRDQAFEEETRWAHPREWSDRETQASSQGGPRQFRASKPGCYMGPTGLGLLPNKLPFSLYRPSANFAPPPPPPRLPPRPTPLAAKALPANRRPTPTAPTNRTAAFLQTKPDKPIHNLQVCLKSLGPRSLPARTPPTTRLPLCKTHTVGSLVRELLDRGVRGRLYAVRSEAAPGLGGLRWERAAVPGCCQIEINSNLYLMLLEDFICSEPSEVLLGKHMLTTDFFEVPQNERLSSKGSLFLLVEEDGGFQPKTSNEPKEGTSPLQAPPTLPTILPKRIESRTASLYSPSPYPSQTSSLYAPFSLALSPQQTLLSTFTSSLGPFAPNPPLSVLLLTPPSTLRAFGRLTLSTDRISVTLLNKADLGVLRPDRVFVVGQGEGEGGAEGREAMLRVEGGGLRLLVVLRLGVGQEVGEVVRRVRAAGGVFVVGDERRGEVRYYFES